MVLLALTNINKKFHKEQGHINILNTKWPGNDWFNPSVGHKVFMRWKSPDNNWWPTKLWSQLWISQAGLFRADRSCFKFTGSRRWCRFGRVPQILIVLGIGECVQFGVLVIVLRKRVLDMRLQGEETRTLTWSKEKTNTLFGSRNAVILRVAEP